MRDRTQLCLFCQKHWPTSSLQKRSSVVLMHLESQSTCKLTMSVGQLLGEITRQQHGAAKLSRGHCFQRIDTHATCIHRVCGLPHCGAAAALRIAARLPCCICRIAARLLHCGASTAQRLRATLSTADFPATLFLECRRVCGPPSLWNQDVRRSRNFG